MPGSPVHHQLTELVQTYVHQGSDAIQPSHPLLSPSPLTLNLSRHQDHVAQRGWFSRYTFSPLIESESESQSLTLYHPMNYTVRGILQARILEWVPFPFSGDLPNPGIELGSYENIRNLHEVNPLLDFPGGASSKEPTCQCR